jgi:hypothetical protein
MVRHAGWRGSVALLVLATTWRCGSDGGSPGNPLPGADSGLGGSAQGGAAGGGAGGAGGSAGHAACDDLTLTLQTAKIELSPKLDDYGVLLEWTVSSGLSGDQVIAEVADTPAAQNFIQVMSPAAADSGQAIAQVDKLMKDIYLRLRWERPAAGECSRVTPAVRLAKPDYADPADWGNGWIRAVSHTHTIADVKANSGGPVYANRINWFNGCFQQLGDETACHQLLLKSFSESGLEWLVAAAKDKGIGTVIVTDHDNVGIWYTDTFRKYNQASTTGPSVVHGLEWTSALGHLTVVGNFLPAIPASSSIFDPMTAKLVHTSTPLPKDVCDDTDENHNVNSPFFDGPDAPCKRADHRGHGDEPLSVSEATASIVALKQAGALVFANHPTNDAKIEPPMKWQLENYELLDGVEVGTPDPTLTNRNNDVYWREKGLQLGHRWVAIAGTDCHVNGGPYTGNTGCNSFHGIVNLTHMDAPYMWIKPLGSTSRLAVNAPDLVKTALRDGRVAVVQDIDPAVIADLGIDANGDGKIDYVSGSTIPACEQPSKDIFEVQVRIKPVQTHNYNVSVWRAGQETKILQNSVLQAGQVWTGATTITRSAHVPPGAAYGHIWIWVRENKTLTTDNDAAFTNPIWFEPPDPAAVPCDTRDGLGK